MSTLVRLRSLLVPACIGLILVVAAGSYNFLWLPSRHRYLDDRNFRVLSTLSRQIRLSIDTFDKMMDHAADSGIGSGKQLKSYLRNVAPELESPDEQDSESVIRSDYGDPPKMAIAADEGTHFLYLGFQRTVKGTNTRYAVRADIEKLVGELLPPDNRNPFDVVLLSQENGTVIFQKSSPGIEVARIDTLDDEPLATKMAKPAVAKMGKPEDAGTEKPESEGKKLSQSSKYAEVTLAGARYRLYTQPLQLSFPPIDPGRKGARESATPAPAAQWILCGLVRADNFRSESQSISYTYILWFLAAILLSVAAYPFLRLHVSSPTERLQARDVVSTVVLACFAAAALSFILLDLYYGQNEFDQSGEEQTEKQMRKLATAIDLNFRAEKNRAFEQLHEFYTRSDLLTALHNAARTSTLPRLTTDGTGCKPSWACQVDILDPKDPKLLLERYPYLQYASWSDSSGNQQVKWTTKKTVTPFIKLDKESYYPDVQRAITDVKRGQTAPGYTTSAPTRGIGSQYSSTTGKNITIFWELVDEDGSPVPEKLDAKHPKKLFCASLVTYPISVLDPVLPGGFQFAIIKSNGTVVFHSDSTRNLRENFLDETDQNQDLRSRVSMRADGPLVTNYMGRRHRLYVRSMRASQDELWSVIVFRDSRLEETMNLEILSLASFMFFLYTGAVALVLVLALWMQRGRRSGRWLWPDSRRAGTYRCLVVTNIIAALLLFVLPKLTNSFALFSFAILISLAAMIFNLVFLRRQHDQKNSSDVRNETAASQWQLGYVGACATLLVVMAVLPCLSFFKVACDFEHKLFIERSQLGLADDVEERAGLVRKRYQEVDLGDYAGKLMAEPETQHAGKLLVEQETTTAPVFSYHEILDTTICPEQACNPVNHLVPATRGSHTPGGWQRRLESFLSWLSPTYNNVATDNRYLAEAGSPDIPRWSSTPVGSAEKLELTRSASGNHARTIVSFRTPLRAPWNEWSWWVGTVAFLAALFWLVRLSLRRIFLLDLYDELDGPRGRADILDPASLSAKPPTNLLVIGSGSSRTVADLVDCQEVQAWDIQDVLNVAQQSAKTADGRSFVLSSTGDQVDEIIRQGTPLVLYNFEGALDNPRASQQSRLALERVLSKLCNSVVIITMVDPVSKSSSEDSERWRTLLRSFVKINPNSSQAQTIDETVEPLERRISADPYHQWLFAGRTEPEKLLLVQLAQEELINPNNRGVVDELIGEGLIERRWGLLAIQNDRFAEFLKRSISPAAIMGWEAGGAGVRSAAFRTGLLVIGVGVACFLIYTQGEVFNTWVACATGLAASVPAFLHLFDTFRHGKGADT
jgi:hypothetical protein